MSDMRVRDCGGRYQGAERQPAGCDPHQRLQLQQAFERCCLAEEVGPMADPTKRIITPQEVAWFKGVVQERPEWARASLNIHGFDAVTPSPKASTQVMPCSPST